jgi:predicted DNA-binding protein (MmcQ/YjbR family)
MNRRRSRARARDGRSRRDRHQLPLRADADLARTYSMRPRPKAEGFPQVLRQYADATAANAPIEAGKRLTFEDSCRDALGCPARWSTSEWRVNRVSLKCEPDLAVALREAHAAVLPGYHLNKRHWNTVIVDGSLPDDTIRDMIEDSYDLVVSKLPQPRIDRSSRTSLRPGF